MPPPAHADVGAPPADKLDAPPPRDGYVWMAGRWARSGDRWVWLEGYFERDAAGLRVAAGPLGRAATAD